MDRKESYRRYCERTKGRIILREDELRPMLELIDCLSDLEPHPADRRVERLRELYRDLTGSEPPDTG